jgi:hypothetical protein
VFVRTYFVMLLSALTVAALVVPPPAPAEAAPRATPVFARAGGVELHIPSRKAVVIGYHQANSRGNAIFKPRWGRTMSLRGRGTHRRSAVDVQVRRRARVVSPVSGRVTAVSRYRLYGRTRDLVIQIRPKGRPGLRATVLHVEGPRVRPGDRVVAGRTVIARRSRLLPFRSQIDRYSGKRLPHIHMELRRR